LLTSSPIREEQDEELMVLDDIDWSQYLDSAGKFDLC
jgi:hypothetical protein